MRLKFIIIAVVAVCYTNLYSQKNGFEKGYFIDNKNNKVECLIKNEEWNFNPTVFEFKKDENSKSTEISINEFIEVVVGTEYKYKKARVKIDKSTDIFQNATGTKGLNLVDDYLLLRVNVDGKATLYSYKNELYSRFFYSLNQNEISQLSYKVYYDNELSGYRKNENYKQELLNVLKCDKITQNDIEELEYSTDRLSDIFTKYNVCTGSETNKIEVKKRINTLELYAKVGVGISSLKYDDGSSTADFGSKTKFRPAIEAEINLSNKRKNYSLLMEFSYQQYNSTGNTGNGTFDIKADYNSIDIAIGLRKYILINPKTLFFVNGYLTYPIDGNSEFSNFEVRANVSPAFGIGCLYNKRYIIDVKYEFGRNILSKYVDLSANYNTLAISIGYKLL
jgi:hypothetical protein